MAAPRLFKTKMCEFVGRSHGCRLGDQCRHAHSIEELRQPPADYDPEARRFWAKTETDSGWVEWSTYRVDGQADDPNPPPPCLSEYARKLQDFDQAKRSRNAGGTLDTGCANAEACAGGRRRNARRRGKLERKTKEDNQIEKGYCRHSGVLAIGRTPSKKIVDF